LTQDTGTPGPNKDMTIDDHPKETRIQYGTPADEIAPIHDAKPDAQRDARRKEMRTGKKQGSDRFNGQVWHQVSMCRHTLWQCIMWIALGSLLLLYRGKDEAFDRVKKMKRWPSRDMSPKGHLMHTTGRL